MLGRVKTYKDLYGNPHNKVKPLLVKKPLFKHDKYLSYAACGVVYK